MSRLQLQFVAPVIVVALCTLLGWLVGFPVAGVIVGILVAFVAAIKLGAYADQRISNVVSILRTRPASSPTNLPDHAINDQINHLSRAAAHFLREVQTNREADRQELHRYAQLLDRMRTGVMRVDRTGSISYANVAAGALFGGRNPTGRTFLAVSRDHELNDMLLDCLVTGRERQHTLEMKSEGRVIDVHFVRLGAGPPEALVVLQDVTELTRLQTLRRDFVANVSHELRTPLSTIKILTETLLSLNEDRNEESRFLAQIDGEVDAMATLVNDLLDLAQVESQESQLALRTVNIETLVANVRERMLPIAERRGVELVADTSDRSAVEFVGDEQRLNQALVNLLNNAISHTPAGGAVGITVIDGGNSIEFAVSDTGSGIGPDDLDRIWERFYKADRSRADPGSGLGLAIVKHTVLAHGGMVTAESTVGQGSVFTISLPKTPRRAGERTGAASR